jgi:putative transposase
LSDCAWRCLKPLRPVSAVGRPRPVRLRQVVNAILYVLKTGCQWRQLPCEFPAWAAVDYYFYRWTKDGTWARLNHTLRSRLRRKTGRHQHPAWTASASKARRCRGAWR